MVNEKTTTTTEVASIFYDLTRQTANIFEDLRKGFDNFDRKYANDMAEKDKTIAELNKKIEGLTAKTSKK